ncbi:hypothetical protein LCGC14_0365450 [marine sediment metagenome]|uniref:Uncharacterized protein n=1 Tax=marine sediment metagenome TaxID=412755 RepID=A0A0F9TCK9_9ZZZZ
MAQTYANLQDRIELNLQDTAGAIYDQGTDGEIQEAIADSLRDVANYVKHIVRVVYQVESRGGSATATTTGSLVDTSNLQFVAGDVDKVVHNTTDDTWAVITGYTSTSVVTLSKDIMASGETYYIYNKGCHASNQINIGDVTDYLWVDHLEYPVGTWREIEDIDGDILTFGINSRYIDDSAETASRIDVHVYFNKRHKVSQLTDLAAAVYLTAGYSAGDTSMLIDGLQSSGTIEEGQEFTIQYRKEIYTVTADATIATNVTSVYFYPGLEADVDNDTVMTLKLSTLDTMTEPVFCKYTAGAVMMSKAGLPIQEAQTAIAVLTTASTAIGNMTAIIDVAANPTTGLLYKGITESDRAVDLITAYAEGAIYKMDAEILKGVYLVTTEAGGAIYKIDAEVAQALDDLDTGRAAISTMSPFGDISARYLGYAQGDVANARGYHDEAQGYIEEARGSADVARNYMVEAQAYIQQAQADEQLSSNYMALAAHELSSAAQYMNQGVGYLRRVNTNLAVAGGWRLFEEKGSLMRNEAIRQLERMAKPQPAKSFSRN